MKKSVLLILVFSLLFSLSSCGEKEYELIKASSFNVDKIEYSTADGIWTEENVYDMVDRYYNEQCEGIAVDISVTFTVSEDFQFAYIECIGGIESLNTQSREVTPTSITKTIGSSLRADGAMHAGTYTIKIEAADFKFYDSKDLSDEVYTSRRDQVKMGTELHVYKFIAV